MLLRAAREACDRHGAALIFDEVQSGLGRTGTLWAYEQSGRASPTRMTMAKALGGGLPIGALVTGERFADVLRARRPRLDLRRRARSCAAAALAALDIVSDREVCSRACASLGERLRGALAELPGVVEVRGRGLDARAEFDLDGGDAPERSCSRAARRAARAQRDRAARPCACCRR